MLLDEQALGVGPVQSLPPPAEYLAGRLTRYQRPVAIKVVDQLPRTPSLKISRALVREHYFNGFSLDGQLEADGVADSAMTGDS